MAGPTLVTGATGFIGSHVARQLLDAGEKVRVLVRSLEKLRDIGLAAEKNLEVARGDLLEPATIPAALEGVSRIHHIAGFISTAPVDRKKVYGLNYDITVNLFEACKKARIEKIVYLASIFALAGPSSPKDTRPAREDSPFNLGALGVDYFKAKRKAELYAWECQRAGLPLVFSYPCFCYGPGDVYVSSSKMVLLFLKQQIPAYVPGGQNVMDVRDAARGLILSMEKGRVGEKYLLGGRNMSYDELFAALSQVTGMPAPKFKMPHGVAKFAGRAAELFSKAPAIDAQAALLMGYHWYYDDSKARRELGHASRPLEETLRDSVRWFCEKGMVRWPKGMAR